MPDDNYRTVEIYLNVQVSEQCGVNAGLISTDEKLTLYRSTKTIVRAHLIMGDGVTYFKPPTGAVWYFAADNSYDPAHADPVATLNANFNDAAFWASLDVANGKIAWLADTATDELTTAMGSNAELANTKAELWMAPSVGADFSLLCQWDVHMKNVVTGAGATSSLPYYLNSLLAFDGDDVVLYYPDGTVAERWSKT